MRGYTEQQLAEVFGHLGISLNDFTHLRRSPSYEIACARLQTLKDRAHRERKRLALELHPDRTGGDVAKTELFKRISAVVTELENSQVQRPRPPPMRVTMVIFNSGGIANSTTSTAFIGNIRFSNRTF